MYVLREISLMRKGTRIRSAYVETGALAPVVRLESYAATTHPTKSFIVKNDNWSNSVGALATSREILMSTM